VAGLSFVDPSFPLHLWDRLLPQAEITLNLLLNSILHPQLSAAAHFNGLIDYNKTYFASPGCKIIAHEKPAKRRTWAPHGQHGYSLGPAMHHYQCQIPEKLAERPIAWNRVDFDQIGPFKVKTPSGNKELLPLTMLTPQPVGFKSKM
jgi:hypothetical protein